MKLRRSKKAKAREAQKAAQDAAVAGSAVGPEPGEASPKADATVDERGAAPVPTAEHRDDSDAAERVEIAETMYKAALTRDEVAQAREQAAAERVEIAETMYKAALARDEIAKAREEAVAERVAAAEALETSAAERAAVAQAREQAAVERAIAAEARERAANERAAAAEAMERATAERAAALEAREKAAAERDSIANTRDRAAAERDSIANARDRAAAERDSIASSRYTAGRAGASEGPDEAALERARLEAELQRAHLDALTGVFRREMGRLALRNEIERARRADGKFVIAFIDVDGLKGVNDREGHAAGDRILRTLAATMRANLRSYDPIVRFGGDEFICGISSIDPTEVQHRIGVIDQSLRNATGVGITAGLATLTSNESLDELTAKADAALIEAKRNRGEQ